jgi:hypothetical protein
MLPTGAFLDWRVRCDVRSSVCCSARERRHSVNRLRHLPQPLCGRLHPWSLRLPGISASFHQDGTSRALYRRRYSSNPRCSSCPNQRPTGPWLAQRLIRRSLSILRSRALALIRQARQWRKMSILIWRCARLRRSRADAAHCRPARVVRPRIRLYEALWSSGPAEAREQRRIP